MIITKTEHERKMKWIKWKTNLEAKGLRVNMRETKIMVRAVNLQTLKDSGKYPCSVCRKGVGSNTICCTGSLHWVHKKCSGITGRLKPSPDYRYIRCKATARKIDGRPYIIKLMGDLIMHGLCIIKNWMLLIHFVTLEIRSVMEMVVILWVQSV